MKCARGTQQDGSILAVTNELTIQNCYCQKIMASITFSN